ncbi:hypothetical protein ANCCAN_06502 [Ancylostoma caninum]|uniref:Uncharacterized protein n=1 Tax=Ancylostoma caninum TaxID=29170 RepID=A0A368GSX7_ANCCA|nr:hypothetical protein ANCCAN_06502 [Ancylostoma caninum]
MEFDAGSFFVKSVKARNRCVLSRIEQFFVVASVYVQFIAVPSQDYKMATDDMYELDYDEEPIADQPVRISSAVSFIPKDSNSYIS